MSRIRTPYLVLLIAISLIYVIWFFVSNEEQDPPKETSQPKVSDSRTARHKNLTRLCDAGGLTVMTDE